MRRPPLGIISLILMLAGGALPLHAAFRVTPVEIVLDKAGVSTLLTITNEDSESVRFQVTAFAWSQSPAGDMVLEPTEDIIFFPSLISLRPGEEKRIRVAAVVPVAPAERTYRLFIEEMPSARPPAAGVNIRVLTKVGVPIFLRPSQTEPAAELKNVAMKEGKLFFQVANTGNAHFVLRGVRITGLEQDGFKVLERQREGWYVLANSVRDYEMEIAASECGRIKRLIIQAETDLAEKSALEGVLSLTVRSCGSQ